MLEKHNLKLQNQEEEISLKDVIRKLMKGFQYLKSKWLVILLTGLIGGSLGFIYAFFQKAEYIANLTYALEEEKGGGGITGALGLASSLGIDLGTSAGGAFGASNLMELMHSRSLVEKALLSNFESSNFNGTLVEYYINVYRLRKKWSSSWPFENPNDLVNIKFPIGLKREKFSRLQDSVLKVIYDDIYKDQLSITQKDKKVSISSIEVRSQDELFSKKFCELLVKEVTNFYVEAKSKKAKMNVAILQKQYDSIKAELNNAINGVAIANDNTYNLNPALYIKRAPSAYKQVDVQANTAILTQLAANLELAKVTLRKETPLVQVIDSPILPLKKEKASKVKYSIYFAFLFSVLTVIGLLLNLWIIKLYNKN